MMQARKGAKQATPMAVFAGPHFCNQNNKQSSQISLTGYARYMHEMACSADRFLNSLFMTRRKISFGGRRLLCMLCGTAGITLPQ